MGRLVTVVLITWNSAPYLRRCLEGIAGQAHRDLELIHVDNASVDDSVARVRERFPQLQQIVNPQNRGFAAAVNQAIRIARGEFVALCNPDAFLTADYLAKIVEALDRAGEKFGAATGTLIRARGYDIPFRYHCEPRTANREPRSLRRFRRRRGLPQIIH